MAKHRYHANQYTFNFEQATLPATPMTVEHAAIVHAHLPPPVLPPIKSPETKKSTLPPWNFRDLFPDPLCEAIKAGVFGDDDLTTEQVESIHVERANELLGLLDALADCEQAKTSGVDPESGKRPRTEAGRKRLQEQLETKPAVLQAQCEDLVQAYADGFGKDAANAFSNWVKAIHRSQASRPQLRSQEIDLPVPAPLVSAVAKGVFGFDENDEPINPSPDEVHEISHEHGQRLVELFQEYETLNERLAAKSIQRTEYLQFKEKLTCQLQSMFALYAEDFGEVAARHLQSWAQATAFRDGLQEGRHVPALSPQYDPGHPWHYLARGDGQKPVPVEEIPAYESDGDFAGRLPKNAQKRQAKLSQLLCDQSRQVEEDKARYAEIVTRGVSALSEYDRNIAYGGDHELAVASSLALKFNHISNGHGRVQWLKRQLGCNVDAVQSGPSSTVSVEPVSQLPNAKPQFIAGEPNRSSLPARPAAEQSSGMAAPMAPSVVGSAPLRGTNNGGVMQTEITESKPATRIEKLDKLHENVEQALDRLAESLEAGRSDTFNAWLTTMSRFHNYSLNNQMLIAFQRPDATHIAGFHAWKKFNRLVSKGEKGIMILAPVTRPVAKLNEQDEQGNTKETTVRRLVNTKVVYVFDIRQTHGNPLPEFAKVGGDAAGHLPALKELLASKGIELYFADRLSGGAQGRSEGGRIGCLNGLTTAEEFRTLAHELAHELLHRGERRQETTQQSRELEAESVAFVVCNAIGLDARQCSTDYIQLYRGNKQMLFESLQFIRQVSADILAVLMPKPHQESDSVNETATSAGGVRSGRWTDLQPSE